MDRRLAAHRPWWRAASLLAGSTLLVAGCGAATPTDPPGPATVQTRDADVGLVLVDSRGRSLYLFEKDEGGKSRCFDACAAVWPPYTSASPPRADRGVNASLLGSTERPDGKRQVTYGGHPLYYYVADNSRPGSFEGQDIEQFGAEWYLVSPEGGNAE